MLNDRNDKYDEEVEYHFSEDQVTYEPEPEAQPKATPADIRSMITTQFSQHKRIIGGTIVFVILMVVVYKMLVPSPTTPETQITPTTPARPVVQAAPPVATPITQQPAATMTPGATPVQAVAPQAVPPQAAQTVIPTEVPNPLAMPTPQTPPPGAPTEQGSVATATTVTTTTTAPNVVADKLTELEDQNAKLMSMLQTDYTQKIAEQQAQNAALQGKIQELNNRIAALESNLGRVSQAIINRPAAPCVVPVGQSTKPCGPKIVYTVQAIIPGRAWLKSDTGDTITVAEGDLLRGLGRITKIDPYDGVVQIDTGARIITLSYGSNGD